GSKSACVGVIPIILCFVLLYSLINEEPRAVNSIIILDSERSDECIDLTMMCVKSKHFPTLFKKIEKNKKKKITEKREFLRKTSF
ncbi:Uncharacterized protein FWK35_00026888, partial [Aphis craccivora]